MTASEWKNKLYYGDNLVWLRDKDHFPNESVDLIYLDPPFNSKANYNVIFKEPGGSESPAQMRAFDDTWSWDSSASAEALAELGKTKADLVELIQWIASHRDRFSTSMAAYISMMAVRFVELHRVLKPTGSLYLHCDPTASHYLKMVLDSICRPDNFTNEIVWKRSDAHSDIGQGARHMGPVHDTLLLYRKSDQATYNSIFRPLPESTVTSWYRYVEPETGRRYNKADLSGPGGAAKGNPVYEWRGITRAWRFSKERMEELEQKGRLVYSKSGIPYLKRYLDESKGIPLQDWWDDIQMLRGIQKGERLGYPTQKPLALLERIIQTSSNEGDVVLDPFCGCGTTIVAAHKLNRQWIGIDVTWLAVDLIEQRLQGNYGEGIKETYVVYGKPYDEPSARALADKSKKEFELWALSLIGAAPRGRNGGVDGLLLVVESKDKSAKVIAQVKGGKSLAPTIVRDLIGTVEKEKAAIGLLITLEEPTSSMRELAVHAGSYSSPIWGKSYPRIQIRTVGELLKGTGFDLPYGESPMKKATLLKGKGRTARML